MKSLLTKKLRQAMKSKTGEFYVDKVIGMVIAVVVGGLLLVSLVALFNNSVLPGLADKIQNLFS